MKNSSIVLIQLFLTLGMTASSIAEIYHWVDKAGVSHASDQPPKTADVVGEVKKMETSNLPSVPALQKKSTPSASSASSKDSPTPSSPEVNQNSASNSTKEQVNKNAQVELYVTSWCPYCVQARQFLRSLGVSFKEYDIERDRDAAARKARLGAGSGVPFAVINGKKIQGYSEAAYRAALQK